MPDVQPRAGRVREFYQRIEFFLCVVLGGVEGTAFLPRFLPFGFNFLIIVFVQERFPLLSDVF